jgi:hypothetical protein
MIIFYQYCSGPNYLICFNFHTLVFIEVGLAAELTDVAVVGLGIEMMAGNCGA